MAGLLGEIYSAGNVARRKLTDLLGNPLLSAQQFVGNINDRARALNELTAAAAREGIDYGPASQQLGGLMAEGYNPMGLTVYHGSPAKFSKFDRTKIGSGEGAQAYGYGHYVAENPAVAQEYQKQLGTQMKYKGQQFYDPIVGRKTATTGNTDIDDYLLSYLGDTGIVRKELLNAAKEMRASKNPQALKEYQTLMADFRKIRPDVTAANTGALYKVDLPDEQIGKMLDFDKPLSEQSDYIKNIIKEYELDYVPQNATGGRLLEEMNKAFDPATVSMHLKNAGIPGIKYLDELSRSEGKGTRNFVVFPGNEGLLTIQKRNNEAIAPTSLLGDNPRFFETTTSDASEIFGQGAKRVKYIDPNSGGVIDVLQKPDGTASVLGLEVPEAMRGQGIGQSLQSQVMQDFPEMMGQVSSKAAAKTAYRLGRRPPNQPEATLDDVYKIMDEYSSVNLVSPDMQKKFMQSLLD